MGDLWKNRFRAHQKQQFKYLRLVFNDHFVLALIIMAGALLYGYARLVRTLSPEWWLRPVVALGLTALVSLGQLASLTERADATFLLPQTATYAQLLYRARRYSMLLPSATLILAAIAMAPLLSVFGIDPLIGSLTLGLGLLALKDVDLWRQLLAFYRGARAGGRWIRLIGALAVWALLAVSLWIHPALFMLGAVVVNLVLRWTLTSRFDPAALDWLRLVAAEERRMGRIYRFYNLFTDVPGLGGGIKRRAWLDWVLKLGRKKRRTPWGFLYARGFVRRTEFSGLYLRLWAIGTILLALVEIWWLAALLTILFVYLVGFQLLPLADAADEVVFTHLYPLPAGQQSHAFGRLMGRLLPLFGALLATGALILGEWVKAAVIAAAGICFALIFAVWYVPLRLRRVANR